MAYIATRQSLYIEGDMLDDAISILSERVGATYGRYNIPVNNPVLGAPPRGFFVVVVL